MQFQIPQFIETEDKIAGPLTLKQLLYLLAAGAVSFITFWFIKLWLWMIITIVVAVIAASFSFIKYNGQPLIKIAFSAFNFFWKPRFFLWKREIEEKILEIPQFPQVSPSAELRMNPQAREEKILTERKNLKTFGMATVKKLWTDLTTTKNPIPKREKAVSSENLTKVKERFSVLRRMTGEKEVARRVDYR